MTIKSRIKSLTVAGLELIFGVVLFMMFNPQIQALTNETNNSAAITFGTTFPIIWFVLLTIAVILTVMGIDFEEETHR